MKRTIKAIAKIHTEFPEKFGIPRQSGLVNTESMIVFEPEFQSMDALKGLDEFSHIWLIWGFQNSYDETNWSPTVRPPRLGGNIRKGVFATRSPFRPNGLGLSVVRIKSIEKKDGFGTVIIVEGADILDQTPIYDIKPYLPYTEVIPEAKDGFTGITKNYEVSVIYKENVLAPLPLNKRDTLIDLLRQDPRPGYHKDENRVYGMKFNGFEVKFKATQDQIFILSVEKNDPNE